MSSDLGQIQNRCNFWYWLEFLINSNPSIQSKWKIIKMMVGSFLFFGVCLWPLSTQIHWFSVWICHECTISKRMDNIRNGVHSKNHIDSFCVNACVCAPAVRWARNLFFFVFHLCNVLLLLATKSLEIHLLFLSSLRQLDTTDAPHSTLIHTTHFASNLFVFIFFRAFGFHLNALRNVVNRINDEMTEPNRKIKNNKLRTRFVSFRFW